MIDYETLRLVWYAFLCVLLIGFAVTDGFDLGVAAQLPLVARTDTERRLAINSIAPVWDGNQVWLILGGGAIFAAFPMLYATAFSGFYAAMFLVLVALILRPVGFDFRNKFANTRWRGTWDTALFIAGFVPSLVFGVAVGNLFLGLPFSYSDELRMTYEGGLLGLLNPFGLLCGVTSLAMLSMHGAAYLVLKTEGPVAARARKVLIGAALTLMVLLTVGGIWIAGGIDGYVITSALDTAGPSNPLHKTVALQPGGWLANYGRWPLLMLAPVAAYAGALGGALFGARRREGLAFASTTLAVMGVLATAGVSLFPFLMPSSLSPSSSLTVWDASSSQRTLFIMFVATVIFLPLIGAYTTWVYRRLKGKLTEAYIEDNSNSLY